MNQADVVLVLGPPRCGTSLAVRMVNRFGYSVPPPEVHPNAANPGGFGENAWVYHFHEKLLERAGVSYISAWRSTQLDTCQLLGQAEPIRRQLARWLSAHMESTGRLVIKDPRQTLFVPLWLEACQKVGAATSIICPVRPMEVAIRSQETYFTPPQGRPDRALAWCAMALLVERQTRQQKRMHVFYDDVIEHPADVAAAMSRLLTPPSEQMTVMAEAASAVDVSLARVRVQSCSDAYWSGCEDARSLADDIYSTLLLGAPESTLDDLWRDLVSL